MATQSFWPKKIQIPQDEVVSFLREQGGLLGETTENLLEAHLGYTIRENNALVVGGNTTSSSGITSGATATVMLPQEVMHYVVRPQNLFLENLGQTLFYITREASSPYPFKMTVFPGLINQLMSYEVTINDFSTFLTEYTKVVKSDTCSTIMGHMMWFINGYRSDQI